MMKRLEGWERRLTAFLNRSRDTTFSWGTMDCALFACDCIRELTGHDPARRHRGRYATEEEALAFGSLDGLASEAMRQHGVPEVLPRFAQRGDPVLGKFNGRDTLGVCAGSRVLFLKLGGGAFEVPINSGHLRKAWRIP